MDNYIVSARKYRPATFKDVVGQKALTTTLKHAIENNKLAQNYTEPANLPKPAPAPSTSTAGTKTLKEQ